MQNILIPTGLSHFIFSICPSLSCERQGLQLLQRPHLTAEDNETHGDWNCLELWLRNCLEEIKIICSTARKESSEERQWLTPIAARGQHDLHKGAVNPQEIPGKDED